MTENQVNWPTELTDEALSRKAVKKKRGRETNAGGIIIELVGVLLCIVAFPIGIIPGLILLIVGGRLASIWRCGACRNKVDKKSLLCPVCKSKLIAFAFCALMVSTFADTNSISATNLNAHQKFYVTYRAMKAKYERAIEQIQSAQLSGKELRDAKTAAGVSLNQDVYVAADRARRIQMLKTEIGKLELFRVQYEKAHPDAIPYRGFNAPNLPQNSVDKIIKMNR